MNLKEFIKLSVRDVLAGMIEAETKTHKFGINNEDGNGIEFDVAVTTEIKKEGAGRLSVLKVVDFQRESGKFESKAHRIKFTLIPRGKRNK